MTFISQKIGDLGKCSVIRRLIAVEMSNDVTFVRIQSDQIAGRGQFNHRSFDLLANEIEESIDLSKTTRTPLDAHVNDERGRQTWHHGTLSSSSRHNDRVSMLDIYSRDI